MIKNASVVLPEGTSTEHTVVLSDGKIAAIGPDEAFRAQAFDEMVDARGGYLAPGFIDLHIHGCHAALVDDGPDALVELCRLLPRYGVTGCLPTLTPLPHDELVSLVSSLSNVDLTGGALVLGFHLEGPYLAISGALPPDLDTQPDLGKVKALIDAAKPYKAIFSISPEIDGITEVIPMMAEGGKTVFITHTAANVAQTQATIEVGVRHATHFYDVFPCPPVVERGVRPCGAVEAILADDRVTVDFVLDGEHVDPVAVKMTLACKGPGGVCLITDSNVGAGLPPGRHRFGAQEVVFSRAGGPARLGENSSSPGGLAGSGLTMDQAVRNAVDMLEVDVAEAVHMASVNPASVLGLSGCKGQVTAGFDADLVLLDKNLSVERTWVAGECVFSSDG